MIRRYIGVALLLVILAITPDVAAVAAFNYQGKLLDSDGSPLTGPYDLTFKLFDEETGGNQIGASVELPDTVVSAGLFTVKLDFGDDVFDGSVRWLETSVESVVLSPRTELLQVPYATHAQSVPWAGVLDSPSALPPSGPAGGDLTGEYPDPAIRDGAVTEDKLADGSVSAAKLSPEVVRKYEPAKRRQLKVKGFSFVDGNGDTTDMVHVTNGRVDAWLDAGLWASTWAMDTQIGALGYATNCMTWEWPSALYDNACTWGTSEPSDELRQHGSYNRATLTSAVRFYKSIPDAEADQGALNDLSRIIMPDCIPHSQETLVMARQRVYWPFVPYANAYPAIQFCIGGKVVVGYGSTDSVEDYGLGGDPPDTINVGFGSPENWTGGPGGEQLCGIVFDWPLDTIGVKSRITLKIYISEIVKTGGNFSLLGYLYPYQSQPATGLAFSLNTANAPLSETVNGSWLSYDIAANKLRKGTNVLVLMTSGGSSTRYIKIGADTNNIVSRLNMKNYVFMNNSNKMWSGLARQTEYYAFYRDSDKITTWARTDAGSDVRYDFVGATLGNAVRVPGRWVYDRNRTYGEDYPIDRSLKGMTSPTRLECMIFGVKNIGDPGYTMSQPSGAGDIRLHGIFSGLTGDDRYVIFSRAGKYPIKWIWGEPAGDSSKVAWSDPRISSYNDRYILASATDPLWNDPNGWSSSWTDTPCGGAAVPAGKRTPFFTADLSGLVADLQSEDR